MTWNLAILCGNIFGIDKIIRLPQIESPHPYKSRLAKMDIVESQAGANYFQVGLDKFYVDLS